MSHGASQRKSSSSSAFHFAAGLCSGTLSAALLQPADLLKTRVQQSHRSASLATALRAIASGPHPLRQLWRGTAPSVLRTGLGSAVYFSGLNALRRVAAEGSASTRERRGAELAGGGRRGEDGANRGGGGASVAVSSSALPRLSSTANLVTGAVARAGAGFLLMPITVLKVRYESSLYHYGSLAGAARDIVRAEGVGGLFKGWGATAVRDAPYAGLYVVFYEESKRRLAALSTVAGGGEEDGVRRGEREEGRKGAMTAKASASINFVSGILAAGLATAITNPFDAIKTRLQLMPAKYGNMVSAARTMLREEGMRSLMDGLALRMGRKAMSSALAWTVYEEAIRRAEMSFVERKEEVL